eukprot:3409192-Pyramimonas_sp.AAC.1
MCLYLYGAFKHPGDYAPPPLTEGGTSLEWFVDALPDPSDLAAAPSIPPSFGPWGHLFMDGSCRRH